MPLILCKHNNLCYSILARIRFNYTPKNQIITKNIDHSITEILQLLVQQVVMIKKDILK